MNVTDGGSVGQVIPSTQPEVKVRTFQSDLLSIKESGGGLPQFQNIKAPKLPAGEAKGNTLPVPASKRAMPFIIAVIVIAFCFVGYLVYATFFAGNNTVPQQPVVPTGAEPGGTNIGTPELIHISAFRRATDQEFQFVLTAATDANNLQTYAQKLFALVGRAEATAKFVEIEAQDNDGKSLGNDVVLAAVDGFVLDRAFIAAHFTEDITIFAYREAGEFWPGYILTLNPDENWLFLKSEIAKIEASSKIQNFFLTSEEGRGEFYDGTIGKQPVRIADFPSGARFVYGWASGRLVISTSYNGFIEAVARL